jgi:hypothetical protein
MMGEEEGFQEEEIFLHEKDSFNLSPTQLKMVSNNIMEEVKIKYEFSPIIISSNFIREESPKKLENGRKEKPKSTQIPRREVVLKVVDYK